MSSRSLRSRRQSAPDPAGHLQENGKRHLAGDSPGGIGPPRSPRTAPDPRLELGDPGVAVSAMELTAKMKIDVQLNVQIFRVRKIDNSTEEITLDLGIT